MHVGSSTSGVNRIGDKTFISRDRAFSCSGPLSPASSPRARLARPIRVRPACWSSHESHWPALDLLYTAVRGAPRMRDAIHPPATLESEQARHQLMPSMAALLQHHYAATRHAAAGSSFDAAGTAPTHRPRHPHVLQADRSRPSTCARKPPGAAPDRPRNGGQAALRS